MALLSVLAIALAILFIAPLVWIFASTFKSQFEFYQHLSLFPRSPTLTNYLQLLQGGGRSQETVPASFLNSVIVAIASTFGALATSSCAGYAFARLKFYGRDLLFLIVLAALMVPQQAIVVPLFFQFLSLGVINTLWALILPYSVSVLGVFLMRQFMMTLPVELDEAAVLDGANAIQIFALVTLPLVKPALSTLGVFVFLYSWNDFVWPLIAINNPRSFTLPLVLAQYQLSYSSMDYGIVLAAVFVAILPPLLAFILAQDFIVQGISRTGIKG